MQIDAEAEDKLRQMVRQWSDCWFITDQNNGSAIRHAHYWCAGQLEDFVNQVTGQTFRPSESNAIRGRDEVSVCSRCGEPDKDPSGRSTTVPVGPAGPSVTQLGCARCGYHCFTSRRRPGSRTPAGPVPTLPGCEPPRPTGWRRWLGLARPGWRLKG